MQRSALKERAHKIEMLESLQTHAAINVPNRVIPMVANSEGGAGSSAAGVDSLFIFLEDDMPLLLVLLLRLCVP